MLARSFSALFVNRDCMKISSALAVNAMREQSHEQKQATRCSHVQMTRGAASATLPTSSSCCMMRLMRACVSAILGHRVNMQRSHASTCGISYHGKGRLIFVPHRLQAQRAPRSRSHHARWLIGHWAATPLGGRPAARRVLFDKAATRPRDHIMEWFAPHSPSPALHNTAATRPTPKHVVGASVGGTNERRRVQ